MNEGWKCPVCLETRGLDERDRELHVALCRGRPIEPVDQVKPAHYKSLFPEPIDVIASWGLSFNLGNVVKYVARADLKGVPLVDLQKAAAYLDHEIKRRAAT